MYHLPYHEFYGLFSVGCPNHTEQANADAQEALNVAEYLTREVTVNVPRSKWRLSQNE